MAYKLWNDTVVKGDCFNNDTWNDMAKCIKRKESSYIIYQDDGITYALNGNTGNIDISNANATIVIQYAMDNVDEITGGLIFLKAGLYEIDNTIDFGKRVRFVGESCGCTDTYYGTCIKLADNTNKDIVNYPRSASFGEIAHIFFDGNQSNQTSNGRAIKVEGGIDLWIHHSFFRYMNTHSIEIESTIANECWNIWISNNCIENGVNSGVHVIHEANLISRCYIVNNHFHGGGSGIHVEATTGGHQDYLKGLIIQGNTLSGQAHIYAVMASNIVIDGNIGVDVTSVYGHVGLNACDNCVVSNNLAFNCTVGFYQGNYSHDNVWIGNQAHNCVTGCTVTANSVDDNDFIFNKNFGLSPSLGDDRNTINGLGYNLGNPASTGDWNGHGIEGIIVRDTTNNKTYIYADGGWREISAA